MALKRISLSIDDTTFDLVSRQAAESRKKVSAVLLEAIMLAFHSDVILCDKCEKPFSVECDEGSVREEGAFCNRHLPKDSEE